MNKVEIFKRYFFNLIDKGQYKKAKEFKSFLHNYFLRKGQKTEYVYCLSLCVSPDQITDEMIDCIE